MSQTTAIAAHLPFAEEADRADGRRGERRPVRRIAGRRPERRRLSDHGRVLLRRGGGRRRRARADLGAPPRADRRPLRRTVSRCDGREHARRARAQSSEAPCARRAHGHEPRGTPGAVRPRRETAARRLRALDRRGARRAAQGGILARRRNAQREERGRRPVAVSGPDRETRRGRARTTRACGSTRARPAPRRRPAESGGHQPCAAGYTSISAERLAFANVSRSTFFASGSRSSSFSATANRYRAFICGTSKCGLSGFCVTRPPPWNDAAAPTRSATAAAVRIVIGPPMQ